MMLTVISWSLAMLTASIVVFIGLFPFVGFASVRKTKCFVSLLFPNISMAFCMLVARSVSLFALTVVMLFSMSLKSVVGSTISFTSSPKTISPTLFFSEIALYASATDIYTYHGC